MALSSKIIDNSDFRENFDELRRVCFSTRKRTQRYYFSSYNNFFCLNIQWVRGEDQLKKIKIQVEAGI